MNVARTALYRPQLDALRAIAVIAVLVHHFLPVAKYIPEDFLTLGLLAVRLFFVIGWSQSHSHRDVLVSASVATVLTLLISALSWHFIERPIQS